MCNQGSFCFWSPNLKMTRWEKSDPLRAHSNSLIILKPHNMSSICQPVRLPTSESSGWAIRYWEPSVGYRISGLGYMVEPRLHISGTQAQVPKPKCLSPGA